MPGSTFIEAEGVDLCTVEEEDIEFVREGTNDPRVRQFLRFGPRNGDDIRRWYENVVVDSNAIVLAIVPREGEFADEPVGMANATAIARRRGVGDIGVWLKPEAQLNTFAHDACLHFIDFLFQEWGLRRLTAETFETNVRVRRLLDRFGFTEEGRLREEVRYDGEWIDLLQYGLLRSEYPGFDAWRSELTLYDE